MDARVCFAPRTRALFRFQHGCPGQRMHLDHERYLGLAMDALIRVCTKNKNNVLEWGMEVHEFPNGGTFSGLLRATWREQRKTPHCKSFNGAVVPHFAYITPCPPCLLSAMTTSGGPLCTCGAALTEMRSPKLRTAWEEICAISNSSGNSFSLLPKIFPAQTC